MDDGARLEKLLNQCKSNDVDVKVDALTKLQAEFEGGIEPSDTDGLVNVLKTCLRTSNQHLTTAALCALVPIIPALVSRSLHRPQAMFMPTSSPSNASSTSSTASTSMIDSVALRQVLHAFLPQGGVLDRLGDREKAQLKAREVLVILGGFAFRASGSSSMSTKARGDKGPETPLQIFERHIKEIGLSSKVWKVREQSILALVHIRRTHHLFPIRPYVSQLVDTLEDTDAHVRETSRTSVVELFTGPGVTDAARADLKKEMTKKGVRKTIVDSVLSKLLSSSTSSTLPYSDGSENGDAPTAPPLVATKSMPQGLGSSQNRKPLIGIGRSFSAATPREISRPASRAAVSPPPPSTPISESAEVRPVYIASTRDLENEFADMVGPFEGKETEHNWSDREQAILRVRGMLKGDVHTRYSDTFLGCLREFLRLSHKTLTSLRTTVCTNTCALYSELAITLGHDLDPHCEYLLTHLLKLANYTKKLAASQSQASVTTIIAHTSAQPRIILPLLWAVLQEKSVQARAFAGSHVRQYLEVHVQYSKGLIESTGSIDLLDKCIRKPLSDPNPAVKTAGRSCFWLYHSTWPDRANLILTSLDSIARKQLEKACPDSATAAAVIAPTVAPTTTKKSSVAAAIAASRAKARAIASAPPSLRHQATSASHAVRATSPPLNRSTSSTTSGRPASPLRHPSGGSHPPSPRSRIISNGSTKSPTPSSSHSSGGSPPPTPVFTAKTTSRKSSDSSPPPSPPASTFRRRPSSPLVRSGGQSSLQQAIETALPLSPPSSYSNLHPRSGSLERGSADSSRPSQADLGPLGRGSSLLLPDFGGEDDLMRASAVPIPEDSDSDESNHNVLSFSAAFEKYPPSHQNSQRKRSSFPTTPTPRPRSQAPSSPRSIEFNKGDLASSSMSNSFADMSTASTATAPGGQPVVEDALRARAEQAESAAERLLELVEPEDDEHMHSTIPTSLLVSAPPLKQKRKPDPVLISPPQRSQQQQQHGFAPVTPVASSKKRTASRSNAEEVIRRAALFQDSPARNGGSAAPAPELMGVFKPAKRTESVWWLKRLSVIGQGEPLEPADPADRAQELKAYISQLESGDADKEVLRKLILISAENPSKEAPSTANSFTDFFQPLTPATAALWEKEKTFTKLFKALMQYLVPTKSEDEIEYGLLLLWELTENQSTFIDGREADIFSALLSVRYSNKAGVLEATNAIRDALSSRIEPVYGLTTMHASLRTFYTQPLPPGESPETRYATYAFGLIALGKFILRLPAEVAEDELPRLKNTLISALNEHSSLVVREAAAASIIAAQLVLRDETQVFALLDGLADEKKNLLAYLFDKHSVRNFSTTTNGGDAGRMEKLEKEMSRLDRRTSMPPKPIVGQ